MNETDMVTLNPSLGMIGRPYFDERNNRVKYFSTNIHSSPATLEQEFEACLDMMRKENATRTTMRAFVTFPYESPAIEASISFNNGLTGINLLYLGYVSPERQSLPYILIAEDRFVERALQERQTRMKIGSKKPLINGLPILAYMRHLVSKDLEDSHVLDMVSLYQQAFRTYTADLSEQSVRNMVSNSIVYAALDINNRIVSTAVAERDTVNTEVGPIRVCELSEMATLRDYRKIGISHTLTRHLVEDVRDETTFIYAEARACHYPINKIFADLEFTYAGRLNKHCILSGDSEIDESGPYENLNVWYMLPRER